jgi:hypothetical protein
MHPPGMERGCSLRTCACWTGSRALVLVRISAVIRYQQWWWTFRLRITLDSFQTVVPLSTDNTGGTHLDRVFRRDIPPLLWLLCRHGKRSQVLTHFRLTRVQEYARHRLRVDLSNKDNIYHHISSRVCYNVCLYSSV